MRFWPFLQWHSKISAPINVYETFCFILQVYLPGGNLKIFLSWKWCFPARSLHTLSGITVTSRPGLPPAPGCLALSITGVQCFSFSPLAALINHQDRVLETCVCERECVCNIYSMCCKTCDLHADALSPWTIHRTCLSVCFECVLWVSTCPALSPWLIWLSVITALCVSVDTGTAFLLPLNRGEAGPQPQRGGKSQPLKHRDWRYTCWALSNAPPYSHTVGSYGHEARRGIAAATSVMACRGSRAAVWTLINWMLNWSMTLSIGV